MIGKATSFTVTHYYLHEGSKVWLQMEPTRKYCVKNESQHVGHRVYVSVHNTSYGDVEGQVDPGCVFHSMKPPFTIECNQSYFKTIVRVEGISVKVLKESGMAGFLPKPRNFDRIRELARRAREDAAKGNVYDLSRTNDDGTEVCICEDAFQKYMDSQPRHIHDVHAMTGEEYVQSLIDRFKKNYTGDMAELEAKAERVGRMFLPNS